MSTAPTAGTRAAAPRPTGRKELEAIWTRLVIDPLADRLVRPLVGLGWVTPNRVTAFAGLLAVASAVAFWTGNLALGGILFQVRFVVDCTDGRLARIRGSATAWGAALDVFVDTTGVLLNVAALATYAVSAGSTGVDGGEGLAHPALIAAVVAACGIYCWTLAHRKSLPGGGQRDWLREATVPDTGAGSLRQRYVAAMARRGMVPTPYAVEAEAFALTLVPVAAAFLPTTSAARAVAAGLWLTTTFYVLATTLNVYRTWRLTSALDREEPS